MKIKKEKEFYQIPDLCEIFGVSKTTIFRRLRKVSFFMQKKQRKRYYTKEEVMLLKTQFKGT